MIAVRDHPSTDLSGRGRRPVIASPAMKRLLITIVAASAAAALLPSAASAAPVCTSVNKGGAAANQKIVVSSCRDYSGYRHREYAVLYIGSASTRAGLCQVSTSTVEVHRNGAPAHWTPGVVQGCNDVLRQNRVGPQVGRARVPARHAAGQDRDVPVLRSAQGRQLRLQPHPELPLNPARHIRDQDVRAASHSSNVGPASVASGPGSAAPAS
jgi:hypothetical protein